jgi:hypothetical protein
MSAMPKESLFCLKVCSARLIATFIMLIPAASLNAAETPNRVV